jgi:hypothetical protein
MKGQINYIDGMWGINYIDEPEKEERRASIPSLESRYPSTKTGFFCGKISNFLPSRPGGAIPWHNVLYRHLAGLWDSGFNATRHCMTTVHNTLMLPSLHLCENSADVYVLFFSGRVLPPLHWHTATSEASVEHVMPPLNPRMQALDATVWLQTLFKRSVTFHVLLYQDSRLWTKNGQLFATRTMSVNKRCRKRRADVTVAFRDARRKIGLCRRHRVCGCVPYALPRFFILAVLTRSRGLFRSWD